MSPEKEEGEEESESDQSGQANSDSSFVTLFLLQPLLPLTTLFLSPLLHPASLHGIISLHCPQFRGGLRLCRNDGYLPQVRLEGGIQARFGTTLNCLFRSANHHPLHGLFPSAWGATLPKLDLIQNPVKEGLSSIQAKTTLYRHNSTRLCATMKRCISEGYARNLTREPLPSKD